MSMQDPISDMLTHIRNAQMVNKPTVSMPHSKLKSAVAEVLKREGYIINHERVSGSKPTLTITLKYHEGRPVIARIERVSRPSLRVYKGKDALPNVYNGLGIAVVSTANGVISDRQARHLGVGGEILCYVI